MSELLARGACNVTIRDLSGGNGSEPLEIVRGFESITHANAFARRYVRDSIERCRSRGMDADAVLKAWFAFGEDAEVRSADGQGWHSGGEARDFATTPPRSPEERDWRALDPRRLAESDDADADEDGEATAD